MFDSIVSATSNYVPFIIVLIVFLFAMVFLVRPQISRIQKHNEFLSSLKVGDRVVTTGGLIGVVAQINNEIVHISFSEAKPIAVLRAAIERSFP